MKAGKFSRLPCRVAAFAGLFYLSLTIFSTLAVSRAQSSPSINRSLGHEILETIKEELKKFYYDPDFHGMDLDARFKMAHEKIRTATSNGQMFSIIAQVLVDLNDSHTYFLPPDRVARVDYGWRMQMIGETCYVVIVKPGSDAEAKGLKVGDVIYSVDGYEPTRDNLWKIEYSYYTLKPRPGMRVVVQDPDGQLRQADLMVKVLERKVDEAERKKAQEIRRPRSYEIGDELIIYKFPGFDVGDKEVDEMMRKVGQHQALILDLRGNSGGYETTLRRLLGYFFDHDVKIGDLKRRKESKPVIAKAHSADQVFKGRLVVLVDSKSASAAELFARVIQLEKRGTVIGDHTAGAVMRGRLYPHAYERIVIPGAETFSFYGAVITDADITMTDGQSLERTGVTPDELLLPTGEDLAARRDPVLSRAATVVGVKIDPEKAGSLFPSDGKTEVNTNGKPDEDN